MGNKTSLITPFFMLLAGAIASIIMYIKGFDLTTTLWGLLIVLVIFYIIGDIARYIYASIRPRIIPTGNLEIMVQKAKEKGNLTGSVVAFENDDQKDHVVQVLQKGYQYKDRTLRPAMVVVAQ